MFCKVGLFYEKNNIFQVKLKQMLTNFKNIDCLKHKVPFRSRNIKRKHFRTTVRDRKGIVFIGIG